MNHHQLQTHHKIGKEKTLAIFQLKNLILITYATIFQWENDTKFNRVIFKNLNCQIPILGPVGSQQCKMMRKYLFTYTSRL
jgi:hypothetical protein